MDTVTQLALGAAVGEAVLGRKVGNRAILWGAVAGLVPDLDVIPGAFQDPVSRIAFHRGVTHSILFSAVMAPLLGRLFARLSPVAGANWRDWTRLAFWSLVTHPLLDAFTTWGTQLFWPLDYRVAFNSIFVVDPLYTLPLLGCVVLLARKKEPSVRRRWNAVGLGLSSLYLAFTLVNKSLMTHRIEAVLADRGIAYTRLFTRPTPFNNVLWSALAETPEGFYALYHSWLDPTPAVPLFFWPRNEAWLEELASHPKVRALLAATQGYYTAEAAAGAVVVNDLRFGQIGGWYDGRGAFVFSYRIEKVGMADGATQVIIHRRRAPIRADRRLLQQLWRRITGHLSPG